MKGGGMSRDGVKEKRKRKEGDGGGEEKRGGREGGRVGLEGQIMEQLISW